MNNAEIDKQIKKLEAEKHFNTIKKNLKESCYDTLFFTKEANYKKKVHFAYLTNGSRDSLFSDYSLLCQEDEWVSFPDDGSMLDIVELLDKNAYHNFMDWKEVLNNLCPECTKYLSLSQVVLNQATALRKEEGRISQRANDKSIKLHKQATLLESLATEDKGVIHDKS